MICGSSMSDHPGGR